MFKRIAAILSIYCVSGQYIFRIPVDSLPAHHYESMYHPNQGETLMDRILHIRERLRALRDVSHAQAGVHHLSENHSSLDPNHPVRHAYRMMEMIFFLIAGLSIAGYMYVTRTRSKREALIAANLDQLPPNSAKTFEMKQPKVNYGATIDQSHVNDSCTI